MIIAETDNGQLRIQGNEVIIDAKDADAAKFRVGARHVPGESGGGGAYSFDVIEEVSEGSRRTEAVLLNGGFNGVGGELSVTIWDGSQPITDASQRKAIEIRHDEVEFKVPVKFSAGVIGGSSGGSNEFATGISSRNGRYRLQVQDDGNLVYYDYSFTPPKVLAVLGTKE